MKNKANFYLQIKKSYKQQRFKKKKLRETQSTFWLQHEQIFSKNYTAIFSPDSETYSPGLSAVTLFLLIFLKRCFLCTVP